MPTFEGPRFQGIPVDRAGAQAEFLTEQVEPDYWLVIGVSYTANELKSILAQ